MSWVETHWYQHAFRQSLASFTRTHLLRTGIALGLFASLRQPTTAYQLARDSRLAPDLLQAWLQAACAQGLIRIVRERDRAYQVSGLARWLIDAPESRSLVAQLDNTVEGWGPVFERMPGLLRGALRPGFGAAAQQKRAAEVARLVEPQALEALARVPGVRTAKRVLDVGCGHGTYLRRLLQRYRDASGVGVEQDADVAAIASQNLADADLVRRAKVRVGEFMSIEFDSGAFDLVMLNNNLYYFPPNDREPLFERIRDHLVPGGVLAIQIPIVADRPAGRVAGWTATHAAFDLFLRAHSNLYGLPDPQELHASLKRVGFEPIGEVAFLPGGAARYVWGKTAAG